MRGSSKGMCPRASCGESWCLLSCPPGLREQTNCPLWAVLGLPALGPPGALVTLGATESLPVALWESTWHGLQRLCLPLLEEGCGVTWLSVYP